jgi:CCR4-NOT transcription complex subunit 1
MQVKKEKTIQFGKIKNKI